MQVNHHLHAAALLLGLSTSQVPCTHQRQDLLDSGSCTQLAPLEAGPTTGKQEARWGASYPTQLRILFIRMLKTRRFEALGTQDVVQFLVVGILSGGSQQVGAPDST